LIGGSRLSGKTLNANVSWTGVTGTFQEQNGGGCTPDAQYVRLYFASPGFAFTHFWWSNPIHVDFTGASGGETMTVSLGDLSQWSDWNGKVADSSPDVTAGFNAAVAKVSTVGVSFGGGCFFENGVTTSDGSGSFTSTFSESGPPRGGPGARHRQPHWAAAAHRRRQRPRRARSLHSSHRQNVAYAAAGVSMPR